MARKQKPNPTAETLKDLEKSGDRVTEWAAENAAKILGVIAAVLLLAGGLGLYVQANENQRDEAADALAIATSQYRQAMGADPIGGSIPEPANVELGEATRTEYVDRFSDVARAHAGTAAGALAWLEAGHLQAELGRLEAAAESFGHARDEAGGSAIAAIAAMRLGNLAEGRGAADTAAEAYEQAASIDSYPLRADALAAAARCWAEAGNASKALSTYQRLESEFADEAIAPQVASLISELRAAQ